MDALILIMAEDMPILKVVIIDEQDTRIWRVIHYYVEEARGREDFSEIISIGIDEKACAKGHQYITVVADLDRSRSFMSAKGEIPPRSHHFIRIFLIIAGIARVFRASVVICHLPISKEYRMIFPILQLFTINSML